jgi:hypothetical protein
MVSRRHALAVLGGCALGAVAPEAARAGGQSEGGPDPYGAEQRLSWIPLKTAEHGRLRIERILILTDRGAFAAALDNDVYPRNEDRLGFPQDIPIIGRLFQPTIRARDLLPQAMIGRVYGFGDLLVVETRRQQPGGGAATGLPLEERLRALASAVPVSAAPLALPVTGVPVHAVSTANDRSSYHVSGAAFRHVGDTGDAPAPGAVASLNDFALGEAFAKDPDMILVVRPSIVNDWR